MKEIVLVSIIHRSDHENENACVKNASFVKISTINVVVAIKEIKETLESLTHMK